MNSQALSDAITLAGWIRDGAPSRIVNYMPIECKLKALAEAVLHLAAQKIPEKTITLTHSKT